MTHTETPASAAADLPAGDGPSQPAALGLSALGGLALGGLTQLGQSFLPFWLHSLANSAGPWVLIAFGFALLSSTRWVACVSGALTLAGLELGYVAAAAMRGFSSAWTTVAFWLTAAAVFGPLVGLAAHLLRNGRAPWGAVGGGFVAGIVSGEGLGSYLTVRDTTTPGYWVGETIVGLVVVVLVGRRTGFAWAVGAFTIGVAGLLATRLVSTFGA